MEDGKDSSGGSFIEALTLIFIGAKLFKAIDWSWWWVLSPLWITAALGAAVVVIAAISRLIINR